MQHSGLLLHSHISRQQNDCSPLHADGNEGPARVAALLRQNPPAGRAFCASLCHAAPAQQIAELIAALRDHLLSSAPAAEHAAATDVPAAAAPAAAPAKGSRRRRGRKQGRADEQPSEVVVHASRGPAGLHESAFTYCVTENSACTLWHPLFCSPALHAVSDWVPWFAVRLCHAMMLPCYALL